MSFQFIAAISSEASFIQEKDKYGEFAFWGRSNVGKSSLINALAQTKIANTSSKPGATQTINIYESDKFKMRIVDFPGYGYSKMGKDKSAYMFDLCAHFMSTRSRLEKVFILIDARHGFKTNDDTIFDLLHAIGQSWALVLTKADLVKPDALAKVKADLQDKTQQYPLRHPTIFHFSVDNKELNKEFKQFFYAL